MYPASNDTDWQVAKFQHREMVAIGQHQQFVASALVHQVERGHRSATIRQQLGAVLLRASHRLRGEQGVSPRSITAEGNAVA